MEKHNAHVVAFLAQLQRADAHVRLYFDREAAISECWDLGKDATGVRPRWLNFAAMSLDDIEYEIDHFAECINQARFDREDDAAFLLREQQKWAEANAYKPNQAMALALAQARR